MHTGGGGGRKVYPPSKIFAKLVNKNAIKHQKGVPSPKNFHNRYIPSLPKFGKNLFSSWIFKHSSIFEFKLTFLLLFIILIIFE
jgi:hypothetical protein